MKLKLGVPAVLLFVSTIALGQSGGGSPFPMAASPAFSSGSPLPLVVNYHVHHTELPPSIATSQSAIENDSSASVLAWYPNVDTGSPFPQAANPSWGKVTSGQTAPSGSVDTGSPFPMAAHSIQ